MSVKRFVAADMRRALELVREELGPEAIILSNRRIKEGVEILCTLEESPSIPAPKRALASDEQVISSPLVSDSAWGDQAAIDQAVAENEARFAPVSAPQPSFENAFSAASSGQRSSTDLADEIERAREKMLAAKRLDEQQQERPERIGAAPASQQQTQREDANVASFESRLKQQVNQEQDNKLNSLQSELSGMRQLLEQQLGRMAWGQMASQSPLQANLYRRFNRLGLSTEASEVLIKSLALNHAPNKPQSMAQAWPEALATLSHQLPVVERDIVDGGGVFAFVGPTGVGKTTTIGKLAARYVLKHGSDKVTLVTTDTYRIAACDQLRSLGRILNVKVMVVDDTHSLPTVLASIAKSELVLIDTAGFRCGDALLKEQLAILSQQVRVKKYLVLSCNSQLQSLKANVKAYKQGDLSGCVLTKLDESTSLGEALAVTLENNLPVAYTTDGQEIPQDIDVARGHQLVTKAVALMKDNSVDEMALADNFSTLDTAKGEAVNQY